MTSFGSHGFLAWWQLRRRVGNRSMDRSGSEQESPRRDGIATMSWLLSFDLSRIALGDRHSSSIRPMGDARVRTLGRCRPDSTRRPGPDRHRARRWGQAEAAAPFSRFFFLEPASASPFSPLGAFSFCPLLVAVGGRLDAVDELEEHHGGGVAVADAGLDDARVAAWRSEKRTARVSKIRATTSVSGTSEKHLAAGVQVLALGQGDHVIGRPARPWPWLGGLDPLVAEEAERAGCGTSPTVLGEASELEAGLAMPHSNASGRWWSCSRRGRARPARWDRSACRATGPSAASAVLISSIDLSPRFLTSARSVSVFLHEVGHQVQLGALERVDGPGGQRELLQGLAEASRRYASPAPASASSSSSEPPGDSGEKWSRRKVARARQRVVGADRAVGPHFQHQLL